MFGDRRLFWFIAGRAATVVVPKEDLSMSVNEGEFEAALCVEGRSLDGCLARVTRLVRRDRRSRRRSQERPERRGRHADTLDFMRGSRFRPACPAHSRGRSRRQSTMKKSRFHHYRSGEERFSFVINGIRAGFPASATAGGSGTAGRGRTRGARRVRPGRKPVL